MKIGYIMQAGVPDVRQQPLSGAASHVTHTINELRNLGHEVRLLVNLDRRIWKSDDLKSFHTVEVDWLDRGPLRLLESVIRRIQSGLHLPYAAWFDSLRFAQACRQELVSYDLLYERMGWMGYGGALAARWLNVPIVLEINGDHLTEFASLGLAPQGAQRWLSLMLMNKMIHSVSHVVATGEGWRTRFIDQWKVPPGLVSTVQNGSDLVNSLERDQLRSFLPDTETDRPVMLVFVGGFDPWQGITVLVRAVADVLSKGFAAHLILIGDGAGSDDVKRMVVDLKIEDRVTFTGRLNKPDVSKYLVSADIGVSPYCGRVEFSGLKLLDYKAAGLAIIASGEKGQPEILQHGKSGWIVPPCSEFALSEAIIHLVRNPDLRRQLGRSARLDAEQHHGWSNTAMQLDRILTEALHR